MNKYSTLSFGILFFSCSLIGAVRPEISVISNYSPGKIPPDLKYIVSYGSFNVVVSTQGYSLLSDRFQYADFDQDGYDDLLFVHSSFGGHCCNQGNLFLTKSSNILQTPWSDHLNKYNIVTNGTLPYLKTSVQNYNGEVGGVVPFMYATDIYFKVSNASFIEESFRFKDNYALQVSQYSEHIKSTSNVVISVRFKEIGTLIGIGVLTRDLKLCRTNTLLLGEYFDGVKTIDFSNFESFQKSISKLKLKAKLFRGSK